MSLRDEAMVSLGDETYVSLHDETYVSLHEATVSLARVPDGRWKQEWTDPTRA
ncbi:MAG: hypothetical protein MUE69_26145 [Myxococcota bacterium]|nr:hypothetical protein [Myxococcota bacterium]